jgi:hypothetical protein
VLPAVLIMAERGNALEEVRGGVRRALARTARLRRRPRVA